MARTNELPPEGEHNGNDGQGRGMEVAGDGSSLMLCSPLIPHRDSLVEIAEIYRSPLYQAHTIDNIDEESKADGDEGEGGAHQPTGGGDKGEGSSQKEQAEAKVSKDWESGGNSEKFVWVPSLTEISLQTMWWGYRMSVNSSRWFYC